MDTIVRPPVGPPTPAVGRPRRRWLRWIVIAMALAVVGVAIAGSIWVAT